MIILQIATIAAICYACWRAWKRAKSVKVVARLMDAWIEEIPDVETFCPCVDCDELRDAEMPVFLEIAKRLIPESPFHLSFRMAKIQFDSADDWERLMKAVYHPEDEDE